MIVYEVRAGGGPDEVNTYVPTKAEAIDRAEGYRHAKVTRVDIADPADVGGGRELYCRLLNGRAYVDNTETVYRSGDWEKPKDVRTQ